MPINHQLGPFAIVPLWVLEALVEQGSTTALRLYVALHEWTGGDDRECHPSRKLIAKRIGASEDTVDRDVKALVAIGALEVVERWSDEGDRTSNGYMVRVVDPRPRENAVTCPRDDEGTGPRGSAAENHTHIEPDPIEPIASAVERQPECVGAGEIEVIQPRSRARTRADDIWDAVVEVCSVDASALTDTARKNVGKTVAELKRAGASGDEVHARSAVYARKYPDAALTVNALRKHWAELTIRSVPHPRPKTAAERSAVVLAAMRDERFGSGNSMMQRMNGRQSA